MTGWSEQDLHLVDVTDEVQVSSTRPDGSQRAAITIWAVRRGSEVYVRSAHGPANGWFRRAGASRTGRFTVAGRGFVVAYEPVDPTDAGLHADLDARYHAKYDRFGPQIVDSVVGPDPAHATLHVVPKH